MADQDDGANGGEGAKYHYQRIEAMIRDKISRKEILPGDRVESEYQLADRLGVHRFTVNKAVTNLVREGLLYRVKGKGTFVSEKLQHEVAGSQCIGIIFPSTVETLFSSWFSSQLLAGIRSATSLDVLIFGHELHSGGRGPSVDEISWDGVDGVVLLEVFSREYLSEVAGMDVPLVVVDYEVDDLGIDCVVLDNYEGGVMATRHLIEQGHRRIGMIGEPVDNPVPDPAWQFRRRGYDAALKDAGIELDERYFAGLRYRFASDRSKEVAALLEMDERPTAIFCADEELAFTTMRMADERGISVPGDLSIVAFGGSEACELSTPQLTTIRASFHHMGRVAVERLLDIKAGKGGDKRTVLPVELVVRSSTTPPAGGE